MDTFKQNESPAWSRLAQHADVMNLPEKHLKHLLRDNSRLDKFSLKAAHIFYDFSRQRVDRKTMELLFRHSLQGLFER